MLLIGGDAEQVRRVKLKIGNSQAGRFALGVARKL